MPTKLYDILEYDDGARFYSADMHVHSYRGSHDVRDTAMTVQAIVDEAVRLDVGVLAITDHNTDVNVQVALEHGQQYAGKLLIVPGVEVSTANGHLLVYSAPEQSAKLRNLLGRIHMQGDLGDPEAHSTFSMADVIREAFALDCICIAAHIDRTKTGFEMLAEGYPNWKKDIVCSAGLYGVECDSMDSLCWYSDADVAGQLGAGRRQLFAKRLANRSTAGRGALAHVQGSDAHTLKQFVESKAGKRLTRLKLNELSFEALRVALTDPEARVRAMATLPRAVPRVLGMHVAGGFLKDQTFRFNDNLNCFIGGRGTGKSTALKTLAFGLGADDELEGVESGPHSVVVYCMDADDVLYRYERTQGNRPTVRAKEDGEISDVPESAFRFEFYRQSELAEVARNPLKNPALFQDFLDRHLILDDLLSRETQLAEELRQNSAALIPLETGANKLRPKLDSLSQVNKKLEIAESGKLKEIVSEQSRLSAEKTAAISLKEISSEYVQGISLGEYRRDYEGILEIAGTCTGKPDNEAALKGVRDAIDRANDILKRAEAGINSALAEEGRKMEIALKALNVAGSGLQESLNERIEHLQKAGLAGTIADLNKLLGERNTLSGEITKIKNQSANLSQLRTARATSIAELRANRDNITVRRKGQLAQINRNLGKTINDYTVFVRYELSGIVDEFKRWFLDAMQGTFFREEVAETFCAAVAPHELAELVLNEDSDAIGRIADVGHEWANKIVERLRFFSKLHALEIMWKPPFPIITVRTKGSTVKEIPVHLLSDGQKHTIMLTIAMLAESNIPLVIDQPEDDLDNAFISATVVTVLREIKERRQVILVTHNANIAVLGDAELIFPMRREGDSGCTFDRGSIDRKETMEAALKILEGGRGAFRRRQEIYGHGDAAS